MAEYGVRVRTHLSYVNVIGTKRLAQVPDFERGKLCPEPRRSGQTDRLRRQKTTEWKLLGLNDSVISHTTLNTLV